MHKDVPGRDNWKDFVKEYPTIVPLRHPYLICESWSRRRKQGLAEKEHWRFVEEWEFLLKNIIPENPYFLPIDSNDRQNYLDKINKDLGLELRTRWKPEYSKTSTHSLDPLTIKLNKEQQELMDKLNPLIRRFYG